MSHDNNNVAGRPLIDWTRWMEIATHHFDAMLERLGWFEESFVSADEQSIQPRGNDLVR
jgi:hypothetical protein